MILPFSEHTGKEFGAWAPDIPTSTKVHHKALMYMWLNATEADGNLLTSKLQIPYKLKDFAESGPKSTGSLLTLPAGWVLPWECVYFPFWGYEMSPWSFASPCQLQGADVNPGVRLGSVLLEITLV